MNWILNTALQLNSTNYIAVLNNQKLIPIDIIRRPNNLQSTTSTSAFLAKYSTKYEIKQNYTKSVNSVRTPLTQCQLYKFPRQTSITQKYQEKVTEKLYPGKRYLDLDLTAEHNDSIFTDTIFNVPTPTEEVIPIIITADTPTSCTKCIPDIEEPNKLHPPNSCLLLDIVNDRDDLSESVKSSSFVLNPIEECNEELNNLSKMVNSPSMEMLSDVCKKQDDISLNTKSRKTHEIPNIPNATSLLYNKDLFTSKLYEGTSDFNKPLPSKSTLIPVFETTDETNYLTDIFPTIPTKLSPAPSISSITKQNSSKDSQDSLVIRNKLFTTSSSHSSEEFKDLSGDRGIRRPIFSIISNQDSSSDSVETKESETANYLFKSALLQQPIYSTLISNESYSDDSQDIPQFINTFNEDLKEMTTNLNTLFSANKEDNSSNIQTPDSSTIEDDIVFKELNKLCSIQRPKSLTFADFSVFNELNIASNIQPSKSWTEIEDATNFNALNKQSPKSLHDNSNQSSKTTNVKEKLSPLETESSLQSSKLSYDQEELELELGKLDIKSSMPRSDLELVEQPVKSCIPRPNSLNFADFSKFKENSNIKISKSFNVIKQTSPEFKKETKLEYDIPSPKYSILVESSLLFKELAKENELNTSSSIETPKSLTITENYTILKEATNENSLLETPKTQSSPIQEEEIAAGAGVVYLTKYSKSQDDSSSSDEFLETFCQPSKDSETSSSTSSSSSLDLL